MDKLFGEKPEERKERIPTSELFPNVVFKDGCAVWQRSTNVLGYPRCYSNGKVYPARRFFYEKYHGAIPPGKSVEMTCGTKKCLDPCHMVLVDKAEKFGDCKPKLSRGDVLALTQLIEKKIYTQKQAAAMFSISVPTLRAIIKRTGAYAEKGE